MSRLEGLRIVLTGAAGGLGSLVAERLRGFGADVTGVDRVDCPACDRGMITDLADPGALAQLGTTLALERVDILVNVAGLQYFGLLQDQGAERIALGYAVNLVAPAILCAAVLPQMIARGDGQIVNLGSVMGTVPYPYFSTYSSAKAGLKGLSQALRREVRGHGLTVTHIAPRAVRTGFNTAQIERFMLLSKMVADQPEPVADRIVRAIERREHDVSIGLLERVFGQMNAMFPAVIDHGLSSQIATARSVLVRP